jgi:methyl-accepting chemotaxis protein
MTDFTDLPLSDTAVETPSVDGREWAFAVVPDEVRAMAERTILATRKVSEIVGAIRDETCGTIVAIEARLHGSESADDEAALNSISELKDILVQIDGISRKTGLAVRHAELVAERAVTAAAKLAVQSSGFGRAVRELLP